MTAAAPLLLRAAAPAAGMAAVARGRAVAWKRMDSVEVDVHLPDVCNGDAFFRDDEEVNADDDDDQVTTIQWLELDCMAAAGASTAGELAQPRIFVALLIGCQSGLIRLVNRHGATVMAQRVHGAPVRGFKLRGFGTSDGTQDLLVICDEGVVVRIDGTTLIPLLQGSVGAGGVSSSASARDRGQSSHVHHAKWQLRGQGAVSDVVCGGVDSQAEGGDFFGATYYKLLVGGAHPTLSLYAACDERSNASASEMVTKLASAAFDLATSFLWGGKSSAPAADDSEPSPIEAPKIAQAVEALDDPHREIRSLCLDASGRVCAACDKLGRVLLLDIDGSAHKTLIACRVQECEHARMAHVFECSSNLQRLHAGTWLKRMVADSCTHICRHDGPAALQGLPGVRSRLGGCRPRQLARARC